MPDDGWRFTTVRYNPGALAAGGDPSPEINELLTTGNEVEFVGALPGNPTGFVLLRVRERVANRFVAI